MNELQAFVWEMETLRHELSGVGDLLKVMLDGAREEDTTLERVVNAAFAVDSYLDILVDRMDQEIWKMHEARAGSLSGVSV